MLGLSSGLWGARGAAAAGSVSPPKQYYMSLGDSLAYGFQQAKFNSELPTVDATTFVGYTDYFARMLRTFDPGLQVVNYGCVGETTSSFLTGCAWSQDQHLPLHDAYTGSQLNAALTFLAAHPGQVSPITIALGSNDVNHLVGQCGGLTNLSCVASGLPATVNLMTGNLAKIIGALRQASPNSEIILMNFYNPYGAVDASTNTLAVGVNKALAALAAATGVRVADNLTPFNLTPPQPQRVCQLTLFCTSLHDIHPSDAGYVQLAQDAWDASGYAALASGTMISFSSVGRGNGEVLFGPSCNALVEVGTRDLAGPGTTHTVYLTGNDLPGTVGSNGLIPGVTYYYEVVTVTQTGVETDNNGGNCYSFTLPSS